MHMRNVEPVPARWLAVLSARTTREVQQAEVRAFRAQRLGDGGEDPRLPPRPHEMD